MLLGEFYNGIEIHRREKIVIAEFRKPHRVISTCRVNGGLSDGLDGVFNHQMCEPCDHGRNINSLFSSSPVEYMDSICARHGLDGKRFAALGTAANMNYAAIEQESFRGLEVVAVCTAGVETNAARAGDPAGFYEHGGVHEKVNANAGGPGTINIMLFINTELIPGAMVRAAATAAEAKTAALQELIVNSRYSDRPATGTGTDQTAIACLLGSGAPLSDAGHHTKLGELIGRTVNRAVAASLGLQNSLTPHSQRSVKVHIERFGTDKTAMRAAIAGHLEPGASKLLDDNFEGVNRDPMTVAAVAALVRVRDEIVWGIIPETCLPEVFASFGAQVAAAVSAKYHRLASYREILAREKVSIDNHSFLDLIFRALATGFADKWDTGRD